MPQNQVAVYQPSQNTQLSTAFMGLRQQLHAAAVANVAQVGDGFTAAEKEAMIAVEELKLINGVDLTALLLRYEKVRDIRDRALWSHHPEGYGSLEQMARSCGISISELSDTIVLCEVIFPYLQDTLGASIAQVWEEVGKSNFRDLIPPLRSIITGEPSGSASVNASVERVLNDTAATLQAAGREAGDADVRRNAVEELVEAGGLPNRELRERLRPDRTTPVAPAVIQRDENRVVVMSVTEDQWTMLQRRLNGYMDPLTVNLPADRTLRQRELMRIAPVREIIHLAEG